MHVARGNRVCRCALCDRTERGKTIVLMDKKVHSGPARTPLLARELVAAATPLWLPRAACLARQLRTVLLHRLPACDGRARFSNP